MTDKQIMIDGCDVSGCTCRYYAYNRHLCSLIGDDLCEEHSDCLYKQLKRKEQECEELNEELYYWVNGEYCDNKCNVVKELDQLKQTLTEIKEIAEKIANYYDGDEYELMRKDAEQILQKISECEVESES